MTTNLSWYHRKHGNSLHDLAIFFVERRVVTRGGKLRSVKDYKDLHYWPCEPDVVFLHEEKGKRYVYVVEIETKATTESRNRKSVQYQEALKGVTDLVVINLDDCPDLDSISTLEGFILERMPI